MADVYYRVCLQGDLPGGEVWSVNPAIGVSGDADVLSQAQLTTWADDIASQLATLIGSEMRGYMSSACRITNVRVEQYGTTGRLAAAAEAQPTSPFVGGGTLRLPTSAAIVLSLRTGKPGRSFRGRLFWPAMAAGLDTTTGRVTATSTGLLAGQAASMLEGLASLFPVDTYEARSVVYSRTLGSDENVTAVAVGDVIDSQRGRRDAYQETYSVAPLA